MSGIAGVMTLCGGAGAMNLELDGNPEDDLTLGRSPAAPIAVQPGNRSGTSGRDGLPTQCGDLTPASFLEDRSGGGGGGGGGGETGRPQGPLSAEDGLPHGPSPIIHLPHVRQKSYWDCGIACTQMVLSYLGHPRSASELELAVGTRSVWTIDLAVLLRRAGPPGLKFLLCTTALGAEEAHSELHMYRGEFADDATRVNALFRRAKALGCSYCQRSLLCEELSELLASGRVVLVILLDIRSVRRAEGKVGLGGLGHFFEGLAHGAGAGSYVGHYVVLTGLDRKAARFHYLDPAQAPVLRSIAAADLDRARCATGTDEDILIIEVPSQRQAPAPRNGWGEASGGDSLDSGLGVPVDVSGRDRHLLGPAASGNPAASTANDAACGDDRYLGGDGGWAVPGGEVASPGVGSGSVLHVAERWRQQASRSADRLFALYGPRTQGARSQEGGESAKTR
mmetsp:Transcript_69517/g.157150  ORF Transcript_69517/g.157150 Transcript_69517/m.157150 type:complete len:452 (+) Transcript_69517:169-1524(+)